MRKCRSPSCRQQIPKYDALLWMRAQGMFAGWHLQHLLALNAGYCCIQCSNDPPTLEVVR